MQQYECGTVFLYLLVCIFVALLADAVNFDAYVPMSEVGSGQYRKLHYKFGSLQSGSSPLILIRDMSIMRGGPTASGPMPWAAART